MIAPSFADIFFNNCFKNGILPVVLPQEQVEILMREASEAKDPTFTVDLEKQEVRRPTGNEAFTFEVDPFRKHCLLNGLDDVGLTMQKSRQIDDFEASKGRAALALPRGRVMAMLRNDPAPLGTVLLLPGDGIGPEVMAEVRRIMDWFAKRQGISFETDEDLVGGASLDRHGTPLTDAVMAKAQAADAVLFGAVGGPRYDDLPFEQKPERGLLAPQEGARPVRQSAPGQGVRCPGRQLVPEAGAGARPRHHDPARADRRHLFRRAARHRDPARRPAPRHQHPGLHHDEIVRIARVGFELARKRQGRVCSVEKANVMESGVLWREEVQKLRDAEYPDIELTTCTPTTARCSWCASPSSST